MYKIELLCIVWASREVQSYLGVWLKLALDICWLGSDWRIYLYPGIWDLVY